MVELLFPINEIMEEQEETTDHGNSETVEPSLPANDIVEEQLIVESMFLINDLAEEPEENADDGNCEVIKLLVPINDIVKEQEDTTGYGHTEVAEPLYPINYCDSLYKVPM